MQITNNFPVIFQLIVLSVFLIENCSTFKAYWNIPTFMCRKHGVKFGNLTARFGIIQNTDDNYRGNQVTILYDPGKFPALLKRGSEIAIRNGGVPQAGDLRAHLDLFEIQVNEQIPDVNNSGIGIIDFESWRPIFRQNFGILLLYKDYSVKLQRERHPHWPKKRLQNEAEREFNAAAKVFVLETLRYAKKLRPNVKWGYYAFPYCYNKASNSYDTCSSEVKAENDRIWWMFDASDIIMPSVYANSDVQSRDRPAMVKGRVREAVRVAENVKKNQRPQVLVYHRYLEPDTLKYLSASDTESMFRSMVANGANGVILWGASNDLNTREKCQTFSEYLETTLGPIVASKQRYIETIQV